MRPTAVPGLDLTIRSAPRPVRRFSKRSLALLLGGASLLVLVSAGIAMTPKRDADAGHPRELYSTANKPTAEGLAALPAGYGAVKPVPELGPPLPGDLGPPILSAERDGRIRFEDGILSLPEASPEFGAAPVMVSPEAVEAAALQADVRGSGLFFSVGGTRTAVPQPGSFASYTAPELADPLAGLSRLYESAGAGMAAPDPGQQRRKEDFLADVSDRSIYNPHRLEEPLSPYQVMAGTVIPAVLITGINSDLPGQVTGQVTEPVYDTVTGQFLLIPQGSKLIGRYDSVIAYGQSRALIVWSRIILPDGSSIRIENLPAADTAGYSGLADRVDNHTLRMFSAATLSSLISIGAELSEDDDQVARALRDAVQEGASRAGDEVLRRQLSVQPTITIRPGWRLRILVQQDLVLKPYGDVQ